VTEKWLPTGLSLGQSLRFRSAASPMLSIVRAIEARAPFGHVAAGEGLEEELLDMFCKYK
jgi:hypothetical protein